MRVITVFGFLLGLGLSCRAAGSTLLRFEGLSTDYSNHVPPGYGGLVWYGFRATGGYGVYLTGTVSPTNVAAGGDSYSSSRSSIDSSNVFDLISAYLTAENASGTQIRVQGLTGTNIAYDTTYLIKTNAPTLINFNYLGINEARFLITNSIFVMDDVTVNAECAAPACKNYVIAWGCEECASFTTNVFAMAAGYQHALFVKEDSTVAGCGMYNGYHSYTNAPFTIPDGLGLTNVIAVSGGDTHSMALKADGTVIVWGINTDGQTNVPIDLTDVIAIAAGSKHSLALKEDGTVVSWGGSGGAVVPSGLSNVVAIAAGASSSFALKADGTVIGWGTINLAALAGLSNIVAIGGGLNCCYSSWWALQADGQVIIGSEFEGGGTYGPYFSNVVAISVSHGNDGNVSLALTKEGTLSGFGYNFCGSGTQPPAAGQPLVPPDLPVASAVACGDYIYMALISGGPPALGPSLLSFSRNANTFSVSVLTQSGRVYRLEYANSLHETNWVALPLVAGNGAIRTLTDATASGDQRFYRVRHW